MIDTDIIAENFKPYNGNNNLKRGGVEFSWTPELIQEYLRCQNDVIYFVENYMKIINVDDGLVPFVPYDYQRDMFNIMSNNRYSCICTARQIGKSTVTCGYILWYVLFHPTKSVAILANKGETSIEILGRVQLAYEHLPAWLQQGVLEWNKKSFILENNSKVFAAATSSDSIRGKSCNLLFIDECAFVENWDEFFTSTVPTISSGKNTKIILVSTPNGLNHFYQIYKNGEERKNNYKTYTVRWDQVPGRDEKWKEDTLSSMNYDYAKFDQEHNVEFMGSSGTLIAGWKLKQLDAAQPVHEHEKLSVFVPPIKDHRYVCVSDVSRGKGLDYSAFSIIDITSMPYDQVATYRNNLITPIDYAEIMYRVCKSYNNALTLVEINDIGEQVSTSLHYDFEYEHLIFTESAGRSGKRITDGGNKADRGIRTTKTVKAVGCSILKLLIEQDQFKVNDFNTIHELSVFSKKNNSYEAEPGNNDDMVMGLVLFAWLSDQQYFRNLTDINTLAQLRDKTSDDIDQDLTPFGFVEDGINDNDEEFDPNSHIVTNYDNGIPEHWHPGELPLDEW